MDQPATLLSSPPARPGPRTRPRVGCVGTGWIGQHRLAALLQSGLVDVVAIADPAASSVEQARALAPGAACHRSLEELLELGVDGVVIATPSALHAPQALRALEGGCAVFCQKPLGRTAAETAAVVDAARAADRLVAADLSYRQVLGMRRIQTLARDGALGDIYAVDLAFHNAYGPDRAWYYDVRLSGGGCLMDLGVHLVDLGLWVLGFPRVTAVSGHLLARDAPRTDGIEDYALATVRTESGALVRLACSWGLPAGRDAVVEVAIYGTRGGAALRNVNGSFYDFVAERFDGTARRILAEPPDAWGGRAVVRWAEMLAAGATFDPEVARLIDVATVLDEIYSADGFDRKERDRS
jgi:predicted dehydrogenase